MPHHQQSLVSASVPASWRCWREWWQWLGGKGQQWLYSSRIHPGWVKRRPRQRNASVQLLTRHPSQSSNAVVIQQTRHGGGRWEGRVGQVKKGREGRVLVGCIGMATGKVMVQALHRKAEKVVGGMVRIDRRQAVGEGKVPWLVGGSERMPASQHAA